MTKVESQRVGPYELRLPKQADMQVEARIYASSALPIESDAVAQLADAASLPGVAEVLATPDIHVGYGVPIGAVVASAEFISPAAVGYDINCGMRLLTTPWDAEDVDGIGLAQAIRQAIPLGEGKHNLRANARALEAVLRAGVPGLWQALRSDPKAIANLEPLRTGEFEEEVAGLEHIERQGCLAGEPRAVSSRAFERGSGQLATLGGGNHFIELQEVDRIADAQAAQAWGLFPGQMVIMIHSGSRGLGHEIGGSYMQLAERFDRQQGIVVPNLHLAILPRDSDPGRDYLGAMNAAANYAFANRSLMALLVKRVVRRDLGEVALPTIYDVAHNLASEENHRGQSWLVHRKGATRAFPPERMRSSPFERLGQPVLIPGSMGTASWLLRGVESGAASLFSTNHGAGRVMSRSAATGHKRGRRGRGQARGGGRGGGQISDQEFQKSMQGVHLICEDRRSIKEEAPAAYKDIDAVIETVIGAKLAQPVARMRPLAVLKG